MLVANWLRYPQGPPGIAGKPVGNNGPSFWTIIASMDGLFRGHFQPDIGVVKMR